MKPALFLLLLTLVSPLGAQDEAPADTAPKPQWVQDFSNLPEDQRVKFIEALGKARELFAQKRTFETIEKLDEAEKIFPDSPDVENLLGACQIEFRAFDNAMEHFKRADELSPNNSSILFNIAEVYFVTKQWAKAEEAFRETLKLAGDDEKSLQLRRLVEFKLLLSLIRLDRLEEAKQLAALHDDFDDTPFPYYSKAALFFNDDKELEAELELRRAARIFGDQATLNPWQDTLMEFGYIKSFFGTPVDQIESE